MKIVLIIFLILSFVGIAVFGAFAMGHESGAHNGCVAVTAQGIDCPKENGVFSFIAFHFDAFRSFSTAVFGENLLASFLTLVLVIGGASLGILLGNLVSLVFPQLNFSYSRYRRREFFNSLSKREFIYWLALHENSPTAF
ncbi:MAG: hypothetical protein AAB596_02000 [Patescibacteria group bacterium]